MNYLLDVNVLLAMCYEEHAHYARVQGWRSLARAVAARPLRLATCAITELGFVRIASGSTKLAPSVSAAQTDLRKLTADSEFLFVGDELRALQLPPWVRSSAHTTDGHLVELAAEYGMRLVTLDRGIQGAELVPELPSERLRVNEATAVAYAFRRIHSTGLWLS
jgi:predicted nucleic acid-binding protein